MVQGGRFTRSGRRMHFGQNQIRNTQVGPLAAEDVRDLAAVLVHEPVEVLLTGTGPVIPAASPDLGRQRPQEGRAAAVALARRNVRSLLCLSRDIERVIDGLHAAATRPPREAEDALEDAGVEMNLRYSLCVTPEAGVRVDGRTLVISNGSAMDVRISRSALRAEGATHFSKPALDRLLGLDIDEVLLSPSAVEPVWLQLEPGGVMLPDTAHKHLHKGSWRSIRKADFIKDFCVGCGRCFVYCPENAVIHAVFDRYSKETSGILGIDTDRCTACGLCASVCPTNRDGYKAIAMIAADAESSPELHCVG